MRHGTRFQAGYTLLEVLVAFAILGMTLAVLFRIFSAGLGNVGVASDYVQAVMIGEARLEAPEADSALDAGRSEGIELGKFVWTRTISRERFAEIEADERSTVAIWRINVSVEWPAGRNRRQIELETLRVADLRLAEALPR